MTTRTSRLLLLPIPSNMFPKPSMSDSKLLWSSCGAVVVVMLLSVADLSLAVSLAVLAVGARLRATGRSGMSVLSRAGALLIPKENVRPAFLRKAPLLLCGGGVGMSSSGLDGKAFTFRSDLLSIEEGLVEEVLNRVDEFVLSL